MKGKKRTEANNLGIYRMTGVRRFWRGGRWYF